MHFKGLVPDCNAMSGAQNPFYASMPSGDLDCIEIPEALQYVTQICLFCASITDDVGAENCKIIERLNSVMGIVFVWARLMEDYLRLKSIKIGTEISKTAQPFICTGQRLIGTLNHVINFSKYRKIIFF